MRTTKPSFSTIPSTNLSSGVTGIHILVAQFSLTSMSAKLAVDALLVSILPVLTTTNAAGMLMSQAQHLSAVLLTSWKLMKQDSRSNLSLVSMELVTSRVSARELPPMLIAKLSDLVHPSLLTQHRNSLLRLCLRPQLMMMVNTQILSLSRLA